MKRKMSMTIVMASEVFQCLRRGHDISEIRMQCPATVHVGKQLFITSFHFPRFEGFCPCKPGNSQPLSLGNG
jgi:hypothetical protein